MNICTSGIETCEAIGHVTVVTWDLVILINTPEPMFRTRHVVVLPARGPPLYSLNNTYQNLISSDKLDKVEERAGRFASGPFALSSRKEV
jgi:hypothetical protein